MILSLGNKPAASAGDPIIGVIIVTTPGVVVSTQAPIPSYSPSNDIWLCSKACGSMNAVM